MMSNALTRLTESRNALDAERRLMNEALTRLATTEIRRKEQQRPVGRLIFGLDLTQSREASLKQARIATAEMFGAIGAIGKILVKLVYFRGACECRESKWHESPDLLCASMLKLSCMTGSTQIYRLLSKALDEKEKIAGVVYVGDHCEEDPDALVALAHKLGEKGLPCYFFHECGGTDEQFRYAQWAFQRMAEASGGLYLEFKPDSGTVLKELLSGVAALSAGGVEAVERMALPTTPEAKELRGRLLLAAGSDLKRSR